MKLELLKKLTRLANNNPNDNEANLAARKVCKMLEEAKFNINNTEQPPAQEKPRTWKDVTRSTEPFWKSKPVEPSDEQKRAQEEFFRRYYEDRERYVREKSDRETYSRPSSYEKKGYKEEQRYYKVPKDYGFDWTKGEPTKKEEKPKTSRECTKCHNVVETAYIGNLYVCVTCVWEEYMRKIKI